MMERWGESGCKLTDSPGGLSWLKHTHHRSCWGCGTKRHQTFLLPVVFAFDAQILHLNAVVWLGGGGWIRGAAQKGEKKGERGPILEEPLSAGGGQPKGRILVLESGRGEEG